MALIVVFLSCGFLSINLIFILYSLNGEYFFLFYIFINLLLLRGVTVVVVVFVVIIIVGSFQLLNWHCFHNCLSLKQSSALLPSCEHTRGNASSIIQKTLN